MDPPDPEERARRERRRLDRGHRDTRLGHFDRDGTGCDTRRLGYRRSSLGKPTCIPIQKSPPGTGRAPSLTCSVTSSLSNISAFSVPGDRDSYRPLTEVCQYQKFSRTTVTTNFRLDPDSSNSIPKSLTSSRQALNLGDASGVGREKLEHELKQLTPEGWAKIMDTAKQLTEAVAAVAPSRADEVLGKTSVVQDEEANDEVQTMIARLAAEVREDWHLLAKRRTPVEPSPSDTSNKVRAAEQSRPMQEVANERNQRSGSEKSIAASKEDEDESEFTLLRGKGVEVYAIDTPPQVDSPSGETQEEECASATKESPVPSVEKPSAVRRSPRPKATPPVPCSRPRPKAVPPIGPPRYRQLGENEMFLNEREVREQISWTVEATRNSKDAPSKKEESTEVASELEESGSEEKPKIPVPVPPPPPPPPPDPLPSGPAASTSAQQEPRNDWDDSSSEPSQKQEEPADGLDLRRKAQEEVEAASKEKQAATGAVDVSSAVAAARKNEKPTERVPPSDPSDASGLMSEPEEKKDKTQELESILIQEREIDVKLVAAAKMVRDKKEKLEQAWQTLETTQGEVEKVTLEVRRQRAEAVKAEQDAFEIKEAEVRRKKERESDLAQCKRDCMMLDDELSHARKKFQGGAEALKAFREIEEVLQPEQMRASFSQPSEIRIESPVGRGRQLSRDRSASPSRARVPQRSVSRPPTGASHRAFSKERSPAVEAKGDGKGSMRPVRRLNSQGVPIRGGVREEPLTKEERSWQPGGFGSWGVLGGAKCREQSPRHGDHLPATERMERRQRSIEAVKQMGYDEGENFDFFFRPSLDQQHWQSQPVNKRGIFEIQNPAGAWGRVRYRGTESEMEGRPTVTGCERESVGRVHQTTCEAIDAALMRHIILAWQLETLQAKAPSHFRKRNGWKYWVDRLCRAD